MSALDLARLQFALTAGFHFLFVSLTLGLAPLLAFMQTRYAITGKDIHRSLTRYWGQLYVINYGMGIITGLVMEFQFGLDWNGVSLFAGNVFGAPLALETLIAFFLESTFLGMWIFGWSRMSRWAHLALIYLVTLTAFASALFIMVANGFLQHPVGGVVRAGTFHLTSFGTLLTNNEALGSLQHLVSATFLTGGLFMAGFSCWHLVRRTGHHDFFLRSLRIGLVVAVLGAAAAINRGFAQISYLKVDQPGKVAQAFGEPSVAAARAASPHGLLPPSWLVIPADIMQYGAFVVGALALIALLLLLAFRGRLTGVRYLFRPLSWAVPLPFVFVLCGWVVREEGRQPWVVYGLLRTRDAVSPVTMPSVVTSFTVFVGIFVTLALVDYFLIRRYARRGPDAPGLLDSPGQITAPVPGEVAEGAL
jgi:cytochrome bd ubiquinol oxidase subunit I